MVYDDFIEEMWQVILDAPYKIELDNKTMDEWVSWLIGELERREGGTDYDKLFGISPPRNS